MRNTDTEAVSAREDVAKLLETDGVNRLGKEAREKTRRMTDDRVYYGSLTPPEDVTQDGYDEVRLSKRDEVPGSGVDLFVGSTEDGFDAYRDVPEPVDVAVVYGDDTEGFAKRLGDVRELSAQTDVRCVTLVPDGRTTAFTDLKTVAVTRLFLDVPGVRVERDGVGDKLAQTSLTYGANDLGFVEEDDGFDPELAAREAGFVPVDRAEAGGYGV